MTKWKRLMKRMLDRERKITIRDVEYFEKK